MAKVCPFHSGGNGLDIRREINGRYVRQLSMLGEAGQRALAGATVMVAGVGGVGGACATYLGAAGIGRLLLLHGGEVALPDLNRQTLMSFDSIGRPRVSEAKQAVARFNPDVVVETMQAKVGERPLDAWLDVADLVVDARYDMEERFLLNRLCVTHKVPVIEASMYGWEIYLFTVEPFEGPCLQCYFPGGPSSDWQPQGFPVLGTVAGVAGILAANEVVKRICGLSLMERPEKMDGQDNLSLHTVKDPVVKETGNILHLDLLQMKSYRVKGERRPDCPVCGLRMDEHGQ